MNFMTLDKMLSICLPNYSFSKVNANRYSDFKFFLNEEAINEHNFIKSRIYALQQKYLSRPRSCQ